MITSRAYLVGVMGFCFYLILLFNTNLPSQFYVLSWLSVGVLVSSLGVALLTLLGLECEWHIAKSHVAEDVEKADDVGGGPTLQFKFANSGSFNKTDLLIEAQLLAPRRDEIITRQFLIEALPSLSSLICELPLTDLPRGRYRLQSLTIHGGDVLGLYRVRRKLSLAGRTDLQDLIVEPAAAALPLEGGSGNTHGAAARAARGQGHGDDFRGTRLYVPGDDLRTVHWKSTARLGQLVVREFHHREQVQRLIIWDGGESPLEATELSLRLTMSLCRALAERGRACGLLRLDAHPLYLPAARGQNGGSLSLVGEALADADASRESELDAACGVFLRHLNGAGEVILVTTQAGDDVLRAAILLRSHGAQVTIAMVNAALVGGEASLPAERAVEAFSPIKYAFSGRRERRHLARDRTTRRTKSAVPTDYAAQAQVLRHAGFTVALTPSEAPGEWSGATQMALLRAAVREVVEPQRRTSSQPTKSVSLR